MTADQTIMLDMSGKVVVVGLGVTGLSVVRFLVSQNIVPVVVDSRAKPPGSEQLRAEFPEVEFSFGDFDKDAMALAKQLVVSPGVAISSPEISYAASQGVEIVGDIELFARAVDAPVIAITGSNGKSTVTTLVGDIISACDMNPGVGGNIGVPALDLLGQGHDIYVLELSSFQLETTDSLKPLSAVILNISEDHLDRYETYADYIAAKQKIYTHAQHCVVNRDDVAVSAMPLNNVVGFTLHAPANGDYGMQQVDGENWIVHNDTMVVSDKQLKISGLHNLSNVMAALALVESLGLALENVLAATRSFAGLAHRMQCVAVINDVQWINDSKATNVGATEAAINGLGQNIILIAGGESKEADLKPLRVPVKKNVHTLILIGRDALLIEKACEGAAKIIHATCMYDAVLKAKEAAKPGDKVLLSPACASFDMFNNYMHRGDVFKDAVGALMS